MRTCLVCFGALLLMTGFGFGVEQEVKPLVLSDAAVILSLESSGRAVASLRGNTTTVDVVAEEIFHQGQIQLGINNERKEFTSLVVVPESGVVRPNLESLRCYGVVKGLAELSSTFMETVESCDNSIVKKSNLNVNGVALTNVVQISSSGATQRVVRSIRLLCNGEKMALVLDDNKVKVLTYVSRAELLKRLRKEGLDVRIQKELVLFKEQPEKALGWLTEAGGISMDKVAKAVCQPKKQVSYAAIVTIRWD